MLEMKTVKKITGFVNTALLIFVFSMAFIFAHYGVTYMVYHSIPTMVAYVVLYWAIYKDKLHVYVWGVYIVITAYMVAGTICLGYDAGYHFYCASLIPLTFYIDYLASVINCRRVNALLASLALVVVYLGCTSCALINGPIYIVDPMFIFRCMIGNALAVFCFLIGYGKMVHGLVYSSEARLSEMALKDQLTGLFNRHYIMAYMDELSQKIPPNQWAAMVDIDNFKGINDAFGHSAGDYVLTELSRIMQEVCSGCVIARWGGEEFLIVTDGTTRDPAVLETLRLAVSQAPFVVDGRRIPVNITIGVSGYEEGLNIDRWIQSADRKLYEGKNNGKDQVVY